MSTFNDMVTGRASWDGDALVAQAMARPSLEGQMKAAFGLLDHGYGNPAREAAMAVLAKAAKALEEAWLASRPTVVLETVENRRIGGVISGTGPEVKVTVRWTRRDENLTVPSLSGGSLSASYGEAIVTTPAGEFRVSVSNRGTCSGYGRLADADAWNQCVEAQKSVGL